MARKKSKATQKALPSIYVPASTPAAIPVTIDSTSHIQISRMLNEKYSHEIIGEAKNLFALDRLRTLKQDRGKYLKEGERQIRGLCRSIEHLQTHTDLFVAAFMVALGTILKEVESSFDKKSRFTKWRRETFGYEQTRYFQQARQLAEMGEFAKKYASIGKNRLLELDRLRKSLGTSSCEEALSKFPPPDTTTDMDGTLTKEHFDAVVTYHRLKEVGLDFVDFDQARLIASYNGHAIEVKTARKIKNHLDQFKRKEQKKKFFEDYLLEQGRSPLGELRTARPAGPQGSLNKCLADLVQYCRNANLADAAWIRDQKKKIAEDILLEAHMSILQLMKILEVGPRQEMAKKKGS